MSTKGLKVVLPSAVTDPTGLRKLEHYYGIEFTRGASNGGGANGYHKMIGDASLLQEMRFHNQMKIAAVKNAELGAILNQTNWRQEADGGASILNGSDGSDIMQVHTQGVYAILGGSHPTYERFIVSDQPFSYDGDEAKYYPAYGETPDYETVLNGVARSIRNDEVQGSHAAGMITGCTDPNFGQPDAGGFPRTSVSRFAYEGYARSKNPDTLSNIPYANSCHQDKELAVAFMFIEFRTKQLNGLLGHAISSNVLPTESTWGTVTGLRMTSDNGASYEYRALGSKVYTPEGNAVSLWEVINGTHPMLKMFEAQLAVSDGATLEGVTDSDGNPVQGMAQGVMTGIWTKSFSFNIQNCSLTPEGVARAWKVDCVLRVPVWRGRTRLWGNVNEWCSGYESVSYLGDDGITHYRIYRSPSVESMAIDNDAAAKTSLGKFAFENVYEYCGEIAPPVENSVTSWGDTMVTNPAGDISTCIATKEGGQPGSANHESAGTYRVSVPNVGVFNRIGVRFGDYSGGSTAMMRFAVFNILPTAVSPGFASGFRVALNV